MLRLPLIHRPTRVAVLRLQGTIAAGNRGQINDRALAPLIERAFSKGKPAAVALSINSPGGSPVQSAMVAARIRRLADEKDIPVYAFAEDVAASGGYWLATAADKIYADQSSIIGSIGVIFSSFGAHELIARHGVERRVYTSGENKSQLDPFAPENPEDVARIKGIGAEVHEAFIEQVKTARGSRLADDPELFTGAFWTGKRALELGLIDGLGHLVPVMQRDFGEDVKFHVYGRRRSLLRRFGATAVSEALGVVEERTLWARYGL